MAGGFNLAVERGDVEVDAVLRDFPNGGTAIDLGAGFGMHSIPLARRSYSVVAIDSSAILLDVLRANAESLPVGSIEGELLSFPGFVASPADLILCMGNTLTHLEDRQAVEQLFSLVADGLRPGCRFVISFRDYTTALTSAGRFIPVRSAGSRPAA